MHHIRVKLTLVFNEIPLLLLVLGIVVALDAIITRPIRLFIIKFISELATVRLEIRLPKIIHMVHVVAKWSLRALLNVRVHKTIGRLRHQIIVNFVRLLILNLAHG